MASQNFISDSTPSPTKTPAEIITRAERDLAASVAMFEALRSYVVAVDEASGSDFVDLHDFSCSMQTLLEVAGETVDRARESVKALVAVPLGVDEVSLMPIDAGFDVLAAGMPVNLPAGVGAVRVPDGTARGRLITGTRDAIVRELRVLGYQVAEGGEA